jgi:hypothetical protein
MTPLYTDGDDWFILPTGVLLLPGPLTLIGLDGASVSVRPAAVSGYRVSEEAALAALLEVLWEDAAPTIEAVLDGMVALLGPDGALAAGMLAAARAAERPESRAYLALCARADAIGARLGGAAGAALSDFPRRLSAAIARQRLGGGAAAGVLSGIEDAARDLLADLIAEGARAAMAQGARLAPRQADLDAIFVAPTAARMADHYAALYARPVAPTPGAGGQTRFVAATVADLRDRTERGQAFPRQYADIVPHLREGPVWVRWWWQGTAWDGLVRLDDRFVWLPKPWRAL